MPVTPLFLARCNSLLAHINFHRSVLVRSIQEDEREIAIHLHAEGKIDRKTDMAGITHYVSRGARPYGEQVSQLPHPLVLELAAENPDNEELVRLYRKNAVLLTR